MEVEVLPLLLAAVPLHRGLEPYSQVGQSIIPTAVEWAAMAEILYF
jgi:hypothetical protein